MTNPINDYMRGTTAKIPLPPNTQKEAELYNNAQNEEDGNTDEYQRRKREEEDDLTPTREEYEANQREAERIIENNSQREMDDLDESEPDNDDNNHLEDAEFSGTYFDKPDDESEQKESLGDRIRAKYDSFKESASGTAETLSSAFGESFGAAAGAASAKYSRFKRGDPIFAVKAPAKRGKNPYTRSISRPGRSISRPYAGGRFGDDFTLGINGGNNLYYPVNEGRQSASPQPTMDLYLPSGANPYEGEFSGRKAFKRSEFGANENYDPFGYGGLSGDGFDNMSGFGSSLMGFGSDNGIFGGMSAGTDTVFGDGAMFNAPRGKSKKESSGFGLDMIIGDSGGMFNTSDPSPRKTTTKRKSAPRKTAKKATKKPAMKRKPTTRKTAYSGFVLP